jgi:superfamily II DNA or RNA helicase
LNLEEYYTEYGSRISQESERLFLDDFLYPLLGSKIEHIVPQYSILDRTGRSRKIDFAYHGPKAKLALEVNGETYHAEGIIPNEMFDDNLFRQNEILRLGYHLVRFSYSQLQAANWRPIVNDTLRDTFAEFAPELLTEYELAPNLIQQEALQSLDFFRSDRGWNRGVLVMPTGTGKTILSALYGQRVGCPVLFLVHRLDILKQSIDAYKRVWPDMKVGILTGEQKENEQTCDVLFASKDTLRQPDQLSRFSPDYFRYVVVDEVHHGQSPTYKEILTYLKPIFMVGMTATPDRTDRKDIFELFDYKKIYEISLQDAIERGFLVPYTYFGLTDNVDYSRIRYQNNRYRVDDLERHLIIPERNEAILQEYLKKGNGDKAIGFCVSIKHADRMADFFQEHGIIAASIHSETPNRDELIARFRDNKIQVAFTVDLFNEGVDFPNVRVLLFLRPTESKTVFIQQLGRGLRLCTGKDRVRILDFIGNYKRANQIRKFISKGSTVTETQENGRTRRKIEYIYSTGCQVHFDEAVEEILGRQDSEELGYTKQDLKEAYFALAEQIGHKPTKTDLDEKGDFNTNQYIRLYGSWITFLRDVGEYTEASYHYPQGTHLGHILSIISYFGGGSRDGTHFDDQYIRLRGQLGEGRLSTYRRQVKYKLQAAMELGILPDDRTYAENEEYPLMLTPQGRKLFNALKPILDSLDLNFPRDEDGIPSTRMREDEDFYNQAIRDLINNSQEARIIFFSIFLRMNAVQQMLKFLFHVCREPIIRRQTIYGQFFQAPFVKQFCDQEGIEEATEEAAKRRCPFLLNILDACGVIQSHRNEINLSLILLIPNLVKSIDTEDDVRANARLKAIESAWPSNDNVLDEEDLSIVRELFGPAFLTDEYFLKNLETFEW